MARAIKIIPLIQVIFVSILSAILFPILHPVIREINPNIKVDIINKKILKTEIFINPVPKPTVMLSIDSAIAMAIASPKDSIFDLSKSEISGAAYKCRVIFILKKFNFIFLSRPLCFFIRFLIYESKILIIPKIIKIETQIASVKL